LPRPMDAAVRPWCGGWSSRPHRRRGAEWLLKPKRKRPVDRVVATTLRLESDVDARKTKALHAVYSYLLRLADELETAEKVGSQSASLTTGGPEAGHERELS
jgi:hypothetical protein